jgi:hypothetical protein
MGCNSLLTVELPEQLSTIGEEAFRDCRSLSAMVLPRKLSVIDDEAFRSCVNLQEIVLPTSLTKLGKKPFAKCEGLARLVCRAGYPPEYKSTDIKKVPLFVPEQSIDAYKKAKTWKSFKTIRPINE